MTNDSLNDCRMEFDAWFKDTYERKPDFNYYGEQELWTGWQAAWSYRQKYIDNIVYDLTSGCPT